MADEGSRELHEPWAPTAPPPPDAETAVGEPPAEPIGEPAPEPRPAPPPPYDIEAELPTTELPAEPAVPPPPPFAPPPPPAAEAPKKKKWPGSAKAVAIILAVALVAAAGGLGYAWYKTNEDKKDLEKVTTAQSQELASQLDKANADLATTKSALDAANADLATTKSSLDAANQQLTTTQGQLKTAQDDAAASKATADALKALFPITASSVAGGLPGSYSGPAVGTVTGGCSVAPCPSAQLTMTIESASGALSVSDPALGRVPLQPGSGGWTANGTVQASFQLQCAGSPQPTSFVLSLAPAAVALDAKNAAQVTTLAGSLVLSAPAPAPVPPAITPACGPGVAAYYVVANRT